MLNTQQKQTKTDYNTTFTEEQFNKLEALTREWNNKCEGDYESTFVGGVAHAYCDSGIMTDGLSARDVEMLTKYFTSETIYNAEVALTTWNSGLHNWKAKSGRLTCTHLWQQ